MNSHVAIITGSLTDDERSIVQRAAIKANAPSYDSALLGAVRLIEMLKKAGVVIPADLADPIATIDDWSAAIKGGRTVVIGTISGDPQERFKDGDLIHTSTVVTPNLKDEALVDGMTVSTRNTRYRLGRRAAVVPAAHQHLVAQSGFQVVGQSEAV
jgi:hypothetical protein